MAKTYAVRLQCPYKDEDTWVILQSREETLDQILQMSWDFECSLHGVQRSIPLEVNEKGSRPTLQAQANGSHKIKQRPERSSKRAPMQLPVVVYGWSKTQGSFHEETQTLIVNASGGLVALSARVELGEAFFVVNKNTREEQECRVAYVQPERDGKNKVGLAFKCPVPGFWRANPRKPRVAKTIQVKVRGIDRSGHPFVQTAQTVDIGDSGARLDGVGYLTGPGEILEVKRGWRKARFRVVWVGQLGTPEANQIGISYLEGSEDIWRVQR